VLIGTLSRVGRALIAGALVAAAVVVGLSARSSATAVPTFTPQYVSLAGLNTPVEARNFSVSCPAAGACVGART
jgi:hypothetical protein